MSLWGVDLGGTKIEGVVIGSCSCEVKARIRIETEAEGGYGHILSRIEDLVRRMERETGEKAEKIGFGAPGTLDPSSGLVKNSNTQALQGKPLADDLVRLLGKEICIANDANCFALAEAQLGAGVDASVVFGVIMGTGVGGGIVVGGEVLEGAQGIAGEWGHNVLDPEGDLCYCGKRGCVETVLSGPALERHYASLSGAHLALPEIVERARSGEAAAGLTLHRLTSEFGRALSVVVNILDPDVFVLGGGVGQVDELYAAGVESLRKWVFSDVWRTRVVRPKLGDSAGVFGAALLTK